MVEFKAIVTGGMRPEMRPEKLSNTEQEILRILKNDPSATTRSIAEQLGVVKSTITRNITKLKDSGIIKRVGSTKQGQWVINENQNSSISKLF
jgi:predicted HTH transcriptional regulator